MAETLLEHGIDVQGTADEGAGTCTAGRSTDHRGDAESSERRVTPHPCTSSGGICYGPASDFRNDGLLHFVSKTHYFNIILCFMSKYSIVSVRSLSYLGAQYVRRRENYFSFYFILLLLQKRVNPISGRSTWHLQLNMFPH